MEGSVLSIAASCTGQWDRCTMDLRQKYLNYLKKLKIDTFWMSLFGQKSYNLTIKFNLYCSVKFHLSNRLFKIFSHSVISELHCFCWRQLFFSKSRFSKKRSVFKVDILFFFVNRSQLIFVMECHVVMLSIMIVTMATGHPSN